MKKLLIMAGITCALFAACASNESAAEKEKQDSIEAAAKADSMLQAELNADTAVADSAAIDSLARPVH